MATYSKTHERDENRLMNKAFFRSLWGLLLCWLPPVGLALAIGGFFRMTVRLTNAHRAKRFLLTLFSVIVLLGVIGVQVGEVYHYIQKPELLDEGVRWAWKGLTGQETLPWQAADSGIDDFDYEADIFATDDEMDMEGDGAVPSQQDDYDAEFDDSVLDGFEEDDSADTAAKDLFSQMLDNKRNGQNMLP